MRLLIIISVFAFSYCTNKPENGGIVYNKNCAGCHGFQLQGGAAPVLIKGNFKHGSSRDSILQSIRNGIAGTEMIKWAGVLSGNEIEAVTDYIVSVRKSPDSIVTEGKPMQLNTKLYTLNIEELITKGLDAPWGIEFVDANRALITGKKGNLYWMVNSKLDAQKITGLPRTYAFDYVGGMMDLALDPNYAENGWIYLAFSHNSQNSTDDNAPGMTKIVRGKLEGHHWTNEQTLFQVNDSLQVVAGSRWGCRFLFDRQGYLYFSIGDMQGSTASGTDPLLLNKPQGKIYRINPDGSIPKDNPLYGRKDVLQAIYSWGSRNAQGFAQHPVTGTIYFTEHGPQGGDELNILKKGANYGWPLVTFGINYDGTVITKDTAKVGMESPILYWTPSIAVSAIDFVNSPLFPRWKNNLLVGALKFQELRRLGIEGNHVTEQEILLKGYGRVRDVKIGPDGALYVLTNTPDALLRITPIK